MASSSTTEGKLSSSKSRNESSHDNKNTSLNSVLPNQERFDHIISEKSIASWIIKFGTHADRLLRLGGETFVDSQGVKRYVRNWQPAEELTPMIQNEKLLEETGCRRVAIECTLDQIDVGMGESTQRIVHASFLNDWQRLWSFLVQDNEDEIAQHAPLLRVLIEFFFHKRTCQLAFVLYVYNMAVLIAVNFYFGHKMERIVLAANYLNETFRIVTYVAMMKLYKGQITGFMKSNDFYHQGQSNNNNNPLHQPHHEHDSEATASSSHPKPIQNLYSTHWTSTLRKLLSEANKEIKELFCCCSSLSSAAKKKNDNKHDRLQRNVSFYYLLNVSLKFLTRHNGIDTQQMNFDRPTYRYMLLFALIGFPLYLIGAKFLLPAFTEITDYCNDNDDQLHDQCNYFMNVLYLQGGGLTSFLLFYIYGASLLIGLVGLAYGGEIVFRLADSWLQKFCCLRRINKEDHTAKLVWEESKQPQQQQTKATTIVSDGTEATKQQKPGGPMTSTRFGMIVNDDDDSDSDTCYSTLHLLSTTALQEISSKDVPATKKPKLCEEDDSQVTIEQLITRDASEHYLFIRELVDTASGIWSPAMTGIFLLLAYVVAAYVAFLITYINDINVSTYATLLMFIATRIIILIIYPIVSISHANSYIYELKQSFEGAGPDDFHVLGGRERWISFIVSCPIVWTYYGLWITWDRLQGVLSTCIVGIAAVIGTIIQNEASTNNSSSGS